MLKYLLFAFPLYLLLNGKLPQYLSLASASPMNTPTKAGAKS